MATTLAWKSVSATVEEAFVGDATNKAFTATKVAVGKYNVASHVSGHDYQEQFVDTTGGDDAAKDAAALALAKTWADEVLVEAGVPQNGTVIP